MVCFPTTYLCTLYISPWQIAQFKAECLLRTLSACAAQRDCQKRGARRGSEEIDDTGEEDWKPRFGNFSQGEYCIFPINFLTAKVSIFQSTVRLYILPSTLQTLLGIVPKRIYRGYSEIEGQFNFLPFNL